MGIGGSYSSSRFHLTAEDIINECGKEIQIERLHVLVTGATSGIGFETSRALACAGAKVYLMGRDQVKLQSVIQNINSELQNQQQRSGGSAQGVICDLNSLASVKQFGENFLKENTPLNVLILNAGILHFNFAQTIDGLEQVMGVNHIAQAYLTQLLMPKLIASAPSRVVIVSAKLHAGPPIDYQTLDTMNSTANNARKGWGIMRSYQQSKLANVLFARALTSRYGDKRVTAYSLHPGVIDTNLAADVPLSGLFKILFKKKSLAEGAATTVYCALKPGLENDSGRYFDDSSVTNEADKWTNKDVETFWEWTERVIQERTASL